MKELWSLARDASVAVGAYVGMVRDRFYETLSNGDGFDERLAQAKARFEAADRLADKEAETEVSEPDDLWAAEQRARGEGYHTIVCRCPSCLDVLQAEQESSPVAAAQRTEEPPEVEPTPPVKAPSGGLNVHDDAVVQAFNAAEEKRAEIAAHLQDAVGDNYDWAPSSLKYHTLPFFHDMKCDDGTVIPGFHHGFDWDGIVYDLFREFDIRKRPNTDASSK